MTQVVQQLDIVMAKRERIKLHRLDGDVNRTNRTDALVLWYDTRIQPVVGPSQAQVESDQSAAVETLLSRLGQLKYTGVVLYADHFAPFWPHISPRLQKVFHIESIDQLKDVLSHELVAKELKSLSTAKQLVITSSSASVLAEAAKMGLPTCYRAYVDDGVGLHAAIKLGSENDFLMIKFRDPTNIPLELVIASLQGTQTVLIKEIADCRELDDAIVTLGVMEVGADGIMFSPRSQTQLDVFTSRLVETVSPTVAISEATVIRSEPVGMGYRSCIDLATLFKPTEGLLVGSTSQGGLLCCPEVFYLPYMELRPFRVNAGAVHSYVYNFDNRTDYMTELRAGSAVMIVDASGKTRKATVGRMKTEIRPLRLIEIEFASGERANILMQDDWHVRIFSAAAAPLNITDLRPGDKVLAHQATPGRHVGIKVDENIVET